MLGLMEPARSESSTRAVLDANVFFDLIDSKRRDHAESAALTADWLADELELCITSELRNEISRRGDKSQRDLALAALGRFQEITNIGAYLHDAFAKVATLLPPVIDDRDAADRRHLARAYLNQAAYFATRDRLLLDHADVLEHHLSVRVGRPSDIVSWIHGAAERDAYAPVRLQGTAIIRRAVDSEAELEPFQSYADGETKDAWLRKIRAIRAKPAHHELRVVGVSGEAPILVSCLSFATPHTVNVSILRARSHGLRPTLLRRALADALEQAHERGATQLRVTAPVTRDLQSILAELAFRDLQGVPTRLLMRGLHDATALSVGVEGAPSKESRAGMNEEDVWPAKVLDATRLSFIVPIQPRWAARLFERRLAAQDLFGVPDGPALALENVYFSASNISIPVGSRIMWYVSQDKREGVGAVAAVSRCLDSYHDEATVLARRFHRLGTYRWEDILATARGNPHQRIRAYRFGWTELLPRRVTYQEVHQLLRHHIGRSNPLASPARVEEAVFAEVYRLGMERNV